jgi:ATP-dependent DNA helicase RecG
MTFNVSVDKEETGNVLNLIESSWDLLRPYLTETRFSQDARFRSQIMYPELACREALVNAIAHRDYSIEGRGIEVHVFNDRLEITSPGGLLSSIKIEDLRMLTGAHQSRNSLISRALREVGYMRELGEGMRRIFELMKSNDLTPPEISAKGDVFSIVLHHKYIYSREEKLWLDSFEHLELGREQKTIVILGYNDHVISPKEIWDAVGIVDTDYYRQLLESLRKLGVLQRSVEKGNAIKIARQKHIPVKHVPQFSIVLPGKMPLGGKDEVADDSEYCRVFVANVPYEAKEQELNQILSRFGEVSDISIPIDRNTGIARGFAFVEFERAEHAQKALAMSGKIKISGRTLYLQKYESKDIPAPKFKQFQENG